jgi:hypothetical protein
MARFAHLVNIAHFPYANELSKAQPLTLQSMLAAKKYSANLDIELLSAQVAEDRQLVPEGFTATPDLTRSVVDVASFRGKKRPLPLLSDLFEHLFTHSTAQYLIYTNVDILVLPFFYDAVDTLIRQGHDALIINRRRIPSHNFQNVTLPLAYAEVGLSHPGFDCFVFHRDIYPHMVFANSPIGLQFTGIVPAYNLICFADKPRLFEDLHITTHLGLDVMTLRDSEYYEFSRQEFGKVLNALKPHLKVSKFPHAEQPFFARYMAWAKNPSLFVGFMLRLEAKEAWQRFRRFLHRFF